jgi:transposase
VRRHTRAALKKTVCKGCGRTHLGWYDRTTRRVRDLPCGNCLVYLELEVRRVLCRCCGKVRREQLDLLAANKRLDTAYLLKESFGQPWNYKGEIWARRFFDNWKASLEWQRLKPCEKFAEMIERHWDGIAAYCHPQNKVPPGFVEGLNHKIRVIQRRA